MPFDEDFDNFLDDDDFVTVCNYAGRELRGILSKEYQESSVVQGYAPMLLVKDDDVEDIAQGDSITVGTDVYTVREIQADGTGMTTLILEET